MAEKKVWDTFVQTSPGGTGPPNPNAGITDQGLMVSFCDIPQGYADNQRIGDKCTISSIRFSYSIRCPSIATGTPDLIPLAPLLLRVIVFIWKDDTVPIPGDILDILPLTLPTLKLQSPLAHDRKIKRKLLMDETYTFFADTEKLTPPEGEFSADYSAVYHPLAVYKKNFNMTKVRGGLNTINFQAGSTDGVNKIYCYMVTNAIITGARDSTWEILATWRVTFIDL